MQRIVSMFMAVALVFGMGLSPSGAAETKPIAALTVASYNDLVGDVNFVGTLVDRPQLGAAMDGLLAMVTQGKGLAGVDKTRPWGVIVQASGENISGYVFLPVTDFKKALGLLELYSTVDAQGGVYKLTPKDGKKVNYVKQQGTWAFFAETPEVLAQCAGRSARPARQPQEGLHRGRPHLPGQRARGPPREIPEPGQAGPEEGSRPAWRRVERRVCQPQEDPRSDWDPT